MGKLIITRGLPGSGKSLWAKEWVLRAPDQRVRVNRDDIRVQMFGAFFGPTVDEKLVSKVELETVKAALGTGRDVVVDACHLKASYVKRWAALVEEEDFEIKEFTTSPDECVFRDGFRKRMGGRGVGEQVIRDLARRYRIGEDGKLPKVDLSGVTDRLIFKPAPEYNGSLPEAFLVDTDGTLADLSHRNPYDTSKYADDGVFENVAELIRTLNGPFYIIGVSGRDEKFREVTLKWWKEKCFLTPDEFYMRPEGNTQNDALVKSEIFDKHIAGRYNVIGVIDDRLRVCRMWHQKGLTTYRVGDPDADF